MKIKTKIYGQDFIIELTPEQLEKVKMKLKVRKFNPEKGDRFFFVYNFPNNKNSVIASDTLTESNVHYVKGCLNRPVFASYEEAEVYKCYLDALNKYSCKNIDWWNNSTHKYFFVYNYERQEIDLIYSYVTKYSEAIYFDNLESAQDFHRAVGEDNIKRFMFGIWN